MAENSKIEWTDHTVNLWWGCSKVHTGCKNCYAEYLSDTRYKNNLWGEKTNRKRIKSAFKDLDSSQKNGNITGKKYKVFIGSMMDIFEDTEQGLKQVGNLKNRC
jgi:protein gp37